VDVLNFALNLEYLEVTSAPSCVVNSPTWRYFCPLLNMQRLFEAHTDTSDTFTLLQGEFYSL
jgi:hypothetical protein